MTTLFVRMSRCPPFENIRRSGNQYSFNGGETGVHDLGGHVETDSGGAFVGQNAPSASRFTTVRVASSAGKKLSMQSSCSPTSRIRRLPVRRTIERSLQMSSPWFMYLYFQWGASVVIQCSVCEASSDRGSSSL
jgi:hypothetical protein